MTSDFSAYHLDSAMLTFFRNELRSKSIALHEDLGNLLKGFNTLETLENLYQAAHAIVGGGRIMQFLPIISIAKTLEDVFSKLKQEPHIIKQIDMSLLSKAVAHLMAFAELSEAAMQQVLSVPNTEIEALNQKINLLISNPEHPQITPSTKVVESSAPLIIADRDDEDRNQSMMDLFRVELENQTRLMGSHLILLENAGENKELLKSLLRAAHSIKGSARVVRLEPIAKLAHAMEDCFVAIQKKYLTLDERHIDVFLKVVDTLSQISHLSSSTVATWLIQKKAKINQLIDSLKSLIELVSFPEIVPKLDLKNKKTPKHLLIAHKTTLLPDETHQEADKAAKKHRDQFEVRIKAESLTHLMGLAGESMVESRWLHPFSESLLRLKKMFNNLSIQIDALRNRAEHQTIKENSTSDFQELEKKTDEFRKNLQERLSELELFINRHSSLSDRLYQEVINSRMRSFGDGVEAFPRMIRDLARQLNKKINFEIRGTSTLVDRDILEKLEAPLAHLLRNAVDHGIESPEERIVLEKSAEGLISLEAQHRAGMLSITVSDDGRGINIEEIRKKIVDDGLIKPEIATHLTEHEIIDFLFLPGFSTSGQITDISGRGIGLDVVQTMIQEVAGTVQVKFIPGKGTSFNLLMPLTLSVIHALSVEISKEPYAFPLGSIDRALSIPQERIELIENRQYFNFEGKNVGLISAAQILGLEDIPLASPFVFVIIISDRLNTYGLVVDKFIGERELVIHELDSRLGKVTNIMAGAFMEDGVPVLIIDVDDIIRSADRILTEGYLIQFNYSKTALIKKNAKRILVVDDSITVREVECRLLRNRGYEVDTAINGVDGWNAIRMSSYDLIITDVDMPRMNGIELLRAIKADPRLKTIPVMIVSYKERDEDRLQGLEAGANYYLTKSGFHDQVLIDAVKDLIGNP